MRHRSVEKEVGWVVLEKPTRPLFPAVLAILLVWIAPLVATVTEPISLRQLASSATLIVRGSVVDVRSLLVPGKATESVATVAVERVLKGQAETFVAVHVPGGAVGRYRRISLGAPALRVNQQAVFFLKRGADNAWRPVGLSAGVVRVLSEPATDRRLVHPVVVQGHTASAGPVVRGDDRRRSLSVDEFEALVAIVMLERPDLKVRPPSFPSPPRIR
jgi:hypothetical protein